MQKFTLDKARQQFPDSFLLVTQNDSVIGIYRKRERAQVRAAKKPHTRIVPPCAHESIMGSEYCLKCGCAL